MSAAAATLRDTLLSQKNIDRLLKSEKTSLIAKKGLEALQKGIEQVCASEKDQRKEKERMREEMLAVAFECLTREAIEARKALSTKPAQGMVIGVTGAGKSELIKQVFRKNTAGDEASGVGGPVTGVGESTTQRILPYIVNDGQLTLYDCPGIETEGDDSSGGSASASKTKKFNTKSMQGIRQMLNDCNRRPKSQEHIHFVWFCVSAATKRFEDCTADLLEAIAKQVPLIIVFTQCDTPEDDIALMPFFVKWRQDTLSKLSLTEERIQICKVLARDKVTDETVLPAFGMDELLNDTAKIIGLGRQMALIRAAQANRCMTICGIKAVACTGLGTLLALALGCAVKDSREQLWRVGSMLVAAVFWVYGVEGFLEWNDVLMFVTFKTAPVHQALMDKFKLANEEVDKQVPLKDKRAFSGPVAAAMVWRIGKMAKHVCVEMIKKGIPLEGETAQRLLVPELLSL